MPRQTDEELATALRAAIAEFDCTSGTLHRTDGDTLELVAHEGIPEPVLERVETVPFGKGMAGAAAARETAVQSCNLQTDDESPAEDGARETGLEGVIATPVFDADDEVAGVIGVGKPEEYEFSDTEREELEAFAAAVASQL